MKNKFLLLLFISILSTVTLQAQKKNIMDLLISHQWVNKEQNYFVKFDMKNFYQFENLEDLGLGKRLVTHKFYLSDTNNFIKGNKYNKIDFKENLIGKVQNGIYIITPHRAIWIIEISENLLTILADAPGAKRETLFPYYGEFPKE